jgi:hypothetical protein
MSSRIDLWGQALTNAKRRSEANSGDNRAKPRSPKILPPTTFTPPPPAFRRPPPAPPPAPAPPTTSSPTVGPTVTEVTVHRVVGPNEVEAGEWEKRQVLPVPHTGDRRLKSQRKRLVAPDKTRRQAMTFTVSDEEAGILRAYASTLEVGFSEWVRRTLFRAAGKKIPSRRRGGDDE